MSEKPTVSTEADYQRRQAAIQEMLETNSYPETRPDFMKVTQAEAEEDDD